MRRADNRSKVRNIATGYRFGAPWLPRDTRHSEVHAEAQRKDAENAEKTFLACGVFVRAYKAAVFQR